MVEYRYYPYQSVLAPFIRDYVAEKRALGFIYNVKAYQLYRFDQYWLNNGNGSINITLEKVNDWLCALPNESKSSHNSRIGAVRDIAVYLNIHGITSYVPLENVGNDHPVIHVLNQSELHELFNVIDSYARTSINRTSHRLACEYPIIFRLYYCCGMRNNEVCSLTTDAVDFEKGIMTVYDGKGQKDRLVYLPDDLKIAVVSYYEYLKSVLGHEPYWLFPGIDCHKHIPKTSIDRKFKEFWNKTSASRRCDKTPTPHSLRHGFVVDRLNKWILEDVDVNVMFIYLSKYLGHKDPGESYYYYHLVNDAFRIIHQKDTITDTVIPEVRRR